MSGKNAIHADHTAQTISLLTTTTGLIDIYQLAVAGEPDWIIPQNLVLDMLDVSADMRELVWKGYTIPLKSLLGHASMDMAVAVLLEAENDASRIGLLVAEPPKPLRVRISNLRDTNDSRVLPFAYQKVLFENRLLQVPDLDRLAKTLLLA